MLTYVVLALCSLSPARPGERRRERERERVRETERERGRASERVCKLKNVLLALYSVLPARP